MNVKEKILLTGGNGMVGRNILALAKYGDYEFLAPRSKELDLMDIRAVAEYIEQNKPSIVIHAAGLVGGIQANIRSPYNFFINNMKMGLNVIEASVMYGVQRFVNLGSSCMYPRNASNPLKEEYILSGELEPTNEGYALAKVAVSRLCDYVSNQHGLEYKTLVPCNLFGYWDKFDPAHSHMIPAVIRKIHQAKTEGVDNVEIWGSGEARREFMFAEDLADFIFYALERFSELPSVMNVGCGYDFTINEYYTHIANTVAYTGGFTHDLTKPVGMQQKLVDVSVQKKLGWAPKHSLDQGLDKTYKYFLEYET